MSVLEVLTGVRGSIWVNVAGKCGRWWRGVCKDLAVYFELFVEDVQGYL